MHLLVNLMYIQLDLEKLLPVTFSCAFRFGTVPCVSCSVVQHPWFFLSVVASTLTQSTAHCAMNVSQRSEESREIESEHTEICEG